MNYKIKKINNEIIIIVVPDQYDRAMLFFKVQEFYESANKNFKDSKFSVWDYFKWYGKKYKTGCFSYPKDFTGFNLPLIVAKKCYEINKIETPYDEKMIEIINKFFINGEKKYLIGVDSLKTSTYKHEMAHAFYYTNIKYKNEMDDITKKIPKKEKNKLAKNLLKLGYCKSVVDDEIQAYLSTERDSRIATGIKEKNKLHKKYNNLFKKYWNL